MSNTQPLPTLDQIIANVTGAQTTGATKVDEAAHAVKGEAPAEVHVTAEEVVVSAEAPVVEGTPAVEEAPAPVAEPVRDPASGRFAALSRKERELRQKEQEIQSRLAAAEARAVELDKRDQRYQELKKSPLKVLKDLGLSYADITQDAVGAYEAPAEDPLEARFKSLQEQIEDVKKSKEELAQFKNELQQREIESAMREVMETIEETAKDDKYEYISTIGQDAYVLVKDVMAEYYAQHKSLLSYEEACDIVEKYYEDSVVAKLTNTKKVKSRFATSAPAKTASATKPSAPKEATERPTTLTNQHASAARATVDVDKLGKSEALSVLASKLRFHD